MINEIYIAGGLGDCLFYTPLIRHLYDVQQSKLIVYVHKIQHLEILKNNPFCDLFLIEYNDYPNLLDQPKPDFFAKRNPKNEFHPLYYMVFLPTLSLKLKASSAISKTFNIKLSNNNPDIFLTDEEIEFGRKKVSRFKFPISINPTSSSSKNRMWYYERWNKVIKQFPDYTFIQVGLESEFLLDGVEDLRGKFTLREQMAIIANSNLFLGVDSFWAHAATALRVKSLVLFGDTSPNHFGHDSNLNIYKKVSCSPCIDWIHGYSCPYSKKCMDSITVEDVVNTIRSFLQNSPK